MKKVLPLLFALIMASNTCFAAEPGDFVGNNTTGQSNVIGSNQYDFETKFTHTFNNGCYLEMPLNLQTSLGVVFFSGHEVYEAGKYGDKPFVNFSFRGPVQNNCNFYVRAYDVNGNLIKQQLYQTGVVNEYDYKKGKLKKKAATSDGQFLIPLDAVRVIVDEYPDHEYAQYYQG